MSVLLSNISIQAAQQIYTAQLTTNLTHGKAVNDGFTTMVVGSRTPRLPTRTHYPSGQPMPYMESRVGLEPTTYRLTVCRSANWTTETYGADKGNRTLIFSLEGWHSTIELHLHNDPFDYGRPHPLTLHSAKPNRKRKEVLVLWSTDWFSSSLRQSA